MNAFFLLIPILLIRYGLLWVLNKEALKRAAFIPALIGRERVAFLFYQVSTILLLVYPFFLKIQMGSAWFVIGLILYSMGTLLYVIATVNYANPNGNGMNLKGLYRVSRNPMYVAYFLYFLGCVLLTSSMVLLVAVIVFQVSAHWIILSEERWCVKEFGEAYIRYMKTVRRYI